MNPNLYVGKIYDGRKVSSHQRIQDTSFQQKVQHNILFKDVEDFKNSMNATYLSPNQSSSMTKPVQKIYFSKTSFIDGELQKLVHQYVDKKLEPSDTEKSIHPRVSYLEREIHNLRHDLIQLRKSSL